MKVTRVFADVQGETHFADQDVPLVNAGPIGNLSVPIPATSVVFRINEAGYDFDWQVAPQRQIVVLLDGAIDLEVSDGQRRRLNTGEILLLEDTTGKGHRTRNVEPRERRSLFIILEPEARLP